MPAKGTMSRNRVKRLREMINVIGSSNDVYDVFDASERWNISHRQARADLNFLVNKRKLPTSKVSTSMKDLF